MMKKVLGWLGAIVICMLLLYCGWNRNKEIDEEINEVRSGRVVDETEASVISEYYLKSFMKYPDDVVFDKSTKKVITESESIFKVTGHMKANNTFGQAIPYIYNIKIRYDGGNWSDFRGGQPINWTFLGGNIYNEATQEITEFDSQDK